MDGLIARELPDMLTIVIVAFIILLFGIAYMRWAHGERGSQRQFEADLRESATILVILLALVLLPAALLLPLPAWVSRAWLAAGALTGWGMLVAAFWNERVVPVATLALPSGLPQPGVLPAALAPFWPVVPDEGETITGVSKRSFQWTYTPGDGRPVELALQLTLNNERYEAARSEPRRPVGDWAYYAERDMPELHALAAAFYRLHQDRNWSTLEQASNVLCFTQRCIDYRHDEDAAPEVEWPSYPIETLMEEVGDCEDDVILTAAVLKRLGFDVALLYYPGHCALGVVGARGLPGTYVVHEGKEYFYGETTAEGWLLGEVPEPFRGRQPDKVEEVKRALIS